MLIPQVCFTCGLPLGDVSEVFREVRRERAMAALEKEKIPPSSSSIKAAMVKQDVKIDDILNRLQIVDDCCRMHVSTAMDWRDYY